MAKKKIETSIYIGSIRIKNEEFLQYLDTSNDTVTISDSDGRPILFFDASCNVYHCIDGKHKLLGKILTTDFYKWEFMFDDPDNLVNNIEGCNVHFAAVFYKKCEDYVEFERTLFQLLYPNLDSLS